MLADSFLKLAVDKTHPKIAAIPAAQQSAMTILIGPGNIAFQPHLYDEAYQKSAGIVPDQVSLVISAKNPFYLPLHQVGMLNIPQIQELAQLIKKGAVTATVVNRGTVVGDSGTAWRDGFLLTYQELQTYFIEPRQLYTDVAAGQAVPTNAAAGDDFLYLPAFLGSEVVIEVESSTPAGDYDISLYTYNPITDNVALIETYANVIGSARIKPVIEQQHQFILPRITTINAGAPTLQVRVGLQLNRLG